MWLYYILLVQAGIIAVDAFPAFLSIMFSNGNGSVNKLALASDSCNHLMQINQTTLEQRFGVQTKGVIPPPDWVEDWHETGNDDESTATYFHGVGLTDDLNLSADVKAFVKAKMKQCDDDQPLSDLQVAETISIVFLVVIGALAFGYGIEKWGKKSQPETLMLLEGQTAAKATPYSTTPTP